MSTSSSMPYTPLEPAPTPPEWKQELAERLATHRSRRPRRAHENTTLPLAFDNESTVVRTSTTVAATVAARYAQAPSYQEMISALEAEAAAAAAAQSTSNSSVEGASASAYEPFELDAETAAPLATHEPHEPILQSAGQPLKSIILESTIPDPVLPDLPAPESKATVSRPDRTQIQVRSLAPPPRILLAEASASQVKPEPEPGLDELLDASVVLPSLPIAANLIEFPRQLIAARKSRPRLAEGPLREESSPSAEGSTTSPSQLRIFEVEPETISHQPEVPSDSREWSSIHLDSYPDAHLDADPVRSVPVRSSAQSLLQPLQPASLEHRAMSLIVDLALVTAALLAFIAVFVASTAHPPSGKPAWLAIGITFAVLLIAYQGLFFTFGEGTPGMRYARIALCTFEDENPTRRAMRFRLAAWFLSAGSLGLGFAWAWFDVDRLAWHDRISRMYQRSY